MSEKFFTKAEAEAKVGKRIRTLVEFSGVPRGTAGRVLRADSADRVQPACGEAVEVYALAIQWDLPAVAFHLKLRHGTHSISRAQ